MSPTIITDNKIQQNPQAIIMVRPANFFPNQETAADNAFQTQAKTADAPQLSAKAQGEFDNAVSRLQDRGVLVTAFEDTPTPAKPDAVFPNNWFSTHPDGTVILYPMYAPVRRLERRQDVVAHLQQHYQVSRIIDLSAREADQQYLEGTGSLVIDHANALAYVALSHRAHANLVEEVCEQLQLKPIMFATADAHQTPIYHTNVMMGVGRKTAVVCLESITEPSAREQVQESLVSTDKLVIDISLAQMNQFAGNVIELRGRNGPVLVMSETARKSFSHEQIQRLETVAELCPLSIPTIEMGGGSARCMIAGIHLPALAKDD
jgi:hypothetical protein